MSATRSTPPTCAASTPTSPTTAFRAGRAAILRDLLAKPHLFHTAYAREHWEAPARGNVERELAALEG